MCVFEIFSQIHTLRPIELLLPLPAPRALPIFGQVIEDHTVVFGGMLGFGKASLGLGRFLS